ncbi:MAG TPA: AAA family ATPase [Candidatus Pacearchaeota archaeon]|nr:AAA family ATPase [Candidatus Pacearchaeota archaeon]
MAEMVAIMGETGHGKSHSIQYLNPEETFIFNCDKKSLPFKGWKSKYSIEKQNYAFTTDPSEIIRLLKAISILNERKNIKYIVIDTLNAVMIDDEMKRMKDVGYDKWVDLAVSVYGILDTAACLRDDLTIFCMFHTQDLLDDVGNHFYRVQTSGQKLQKIKLESKFPVVLHSKCDYGDEKNEYYFETQANHSTAKSPEGMFPAKRIPNNLKLVADYVTEYNS